jgi:hypothetical protein
MYLFCYNLLNQGIFSVSWSAGGVRNISKGAHVDGSYSKFFDLIMRQLKGSRYTDNEISQKIYQILQTDPMVRRCFLEYLMFVPKVNELPSPQLGFIEKTATGELKVSEA